MPVNYRGLIFDLAVIAVNIFLVRLLTRHIGRLLILSFLNDDVQAAHTFLYIILAALAAQLVGAALKRRPLQARLLARHEGDAGPFGCLMILHLCLMLVTGCAVVALAQTEATPWVLFPVILLCIVPTVFVWRAMTPYSKPPKPDWRNSREVETLADLCLFAYMLVNLAVWNTVTAGSNIRAAGVGDAVSRALGFIILSPVILLFYLPPRILFLVEDYKYPATWITMTLAIAPVAYRVIIGTPLKTDW
ncbi:MAG TPA: hypothetical protein VHU19_00465 [Pyrinomonadaceae bacterium]|jgi:hypothetical protein|nr:hypothetical protein [Pyrinomonadaceae bacterium]